MSLEECVNFKKRFNIETFGTRVPKPISSFIHLSKSIPTTILNRIEKMGFYEPTPVQSQVIPCILQGRNTIILSETGSGKTISYLIPIVVKVLDLIKQWKSVSGKKNVYALILTLTRELCNQVYSLLQKLCKGINLRITLITAGVDKTEMFRSVYNGCEIAICTPQRLVDMISSKGINLSESKFFVLDEADKMFTKEYESKVISILNLLRDDTLMVLVSASTTDEIYKKIKSLVRNTITVKVGLSDVINLENIQLKFLTFFSHNFLAQKNTWLEDNLPALESQSQVIIFCNSRETVEQLYSFLYSAYKSCCKLYGDMLPTERHGTISFFKKGNYRTLIATDLVCRGLDIPAVGVVINYDTPRHFHTFLHRVGRCARGSSKGTSYTFFTKNDNKMAAYILNYLENESKKSKIKINTTEDPNSTGYITIPEHLKALAMTFGPYKRSKQLGMDFIEYMSKGTLLKQNSNRGKRPLEVNKTSAFVTSKFSKTSTHDFTIIGYSEEENIGKEYTANDEISSSDEE
ncbi:DEAD/DEAH box helicase family protein [Theileria parva strain Muguga]|uniref:DEAD/DEAH box helicase family protein n=1 Tax=Theileria parva strain Muguga TaxID=333668 RepID=UPI001C61AD13|nr:DEAD/DEAH box helicase family protein [Theileria parva strain Muguga]EAN32569.2 DEAD/DEAH box helicase family protein [Theileria parva strain Muguga]